MYAYIMVLLKTEIQSSDLLAARKQKSQCTTVKH